MLHMRIADFSKIDQGTVATFILGTLVAGASAAIILLLYLPLR